MRNERDLASNFSKINDTLHLLTFNDLIDFKPAKLFSFYANACFKLISLAVAWPKFAKKLQCTVYMNTFYTNVLDSFLPNISTMRCNQKFISPKESLTAHLYIFLFQQELELASFSPLEIPFYRLGPTSDFLVTKPKATVGKSTALFVKFVEKGKFSDLLAYSGKISIKLAKKAQIPRILINKLSLDLNSSNIFKYLELKIVRQNSQIHPFLVLKNRQNSEFCRTVLDSTYSFFKLG